MKTIEETAREVWKQARAKDSDIELIEAGIIAGLRMAADKAQSHVWFMPIDWWTTASKNTVASKSANECVEAIESLIPTPAESAEKGQAQ